MTYLSELQNRYGSELFNDAYNKRISEFADYGDQESDKDKHGYGKRIPYIGWLWCSLDFAGKIVMIGDCGSFIGFIGNNKWDYPDRSMTEQELDTFVDHFERAYALMKQGEDEAKLQAEEEFDKLWEWFQTLKGCL